MTRSDQPGWALSLQSWGGAPFHNTPESWAGNWVLGPFYFRECGQGPLRPGLPLTGLLGSPRCQARTLRNEETVSAGSGRSRQRSEVCLRPQKADPGHLLASLRSLALLSLYTILNFYLRLYQRQMAGVVWGGTVRDDLGSRGAAAEGMPVWPELLLGMALAVGRLGVQSSSSIVALPAECWRCSPWSTGSQCHSACRAGMVWCPAKQSGIAQD